MEKGDVSCDTKTRVLAHVRTANTHVIESTAASVPARVYGVAKPRKRAEQTEIGLPSWLCASVGVGWFTPPYSKYIKTHMWRLRLPSGAAVQWLQATALVLEGEEHQRG